MLNGWTPTIDRKTQIVNHINSCQEFLADNPTNEYWQTQLEILKSQYEMHPVDKAQQVEREIDNTLEWQDNAIAEHNDWLDENRTMEDAR